jgi:hypothetical protein
VKAIELTWGGLRHWSGVGTGEVERRPDRGAGVADGIVGRAVGKASEALQAERRSNR